MEEAAGGKESASGGPAGIKKRKMDPTIGQREKPGDSSSRALDPPNLRVGREEKVMARIMKMLEAKDLVTLRPTCTMWNRVAIPELQRKHESIKLYNAATSDTNTVGQYLEVLRSGSKMKMKIPYSKYRIYDPTPTPDFVQFFEQYGKTIESMELDSRKDQDEKLVLTPNLDIIARVILDFSPNLSNLTLNVDRLLPKEAPLWSGQTIDFAPTPNLKIVKFQSTHPDDPDTKTELKPVYGQLLCKILKSAQSLESLELANVHLSTTTDRDRDQFDDFVLHTDRLRTLKVELNLTEGAVYPNKMPLLTEALENRNHFRLDHFSLQFKQSVLYCENRKIVVDVFKFLEKQASTLQTLKIHAIGHHFIWKSIKLPKMDTLKSLTFSTQDYQRPNRESFHDYYDEYYYPPDPDSQKDYEKVEFFDGDERSTFQSNFPNLKHLTLSPDDPFDEWEFLDFAHPGLTEVELREDRQQFGFGKGIWNDIWKIWPALTKLHIHLTDELTGAKMDSWLTGIQKCGFKQVNTSIAEFRYGCVSLEDLESLHRQYKYSLSGAITDLAHLREFRLEGSPGAWARWITDIGGYFGLAVISAQLWRMEVRMKVQPEEERWRRPPSQKPQLSRNCVACIGTLFNSKIGPAEEGGAPEPFLVLQLDTEDLHNLEESDGHYGEEDEFGLEELEEPEAPSSVSFSQNWHMEFFGS